MVSRIERGHLDLLPLATVRRVAAALDVRVEVRAGWRGGDLGRLLNARHSAMHEAVARRFARRGDWTVAPEVSFARFGERGVIDLLAWHAGRSALLVIELKTELVDIQETMATLDRKRRLAKYVGADHGWSATHVSAWLILADSRTNRRHVALHRATLRNAFPLDGRSISAWLDNPTRSVAALTFLTDIRRANGGTSLHSPKRIHAAARNGSTRPTRELKRTEPGFQRHAEHDPLALDYQ